MPKCTKEFREVAKGCGIKYKYKIPSKELKAVLGYRPLNKRRKVEGSEEVGFCKVYDSIKEAGKNRGISNSSAIKYAIDNDRPFVKGR